MVMTIFQLRFQWRKQHAASCPKKQAKRRKTRRYLEGAGLYEAITYSLTSAEKAKQYALKETALEPIRLALPMSEERSQLRLSLVPHLLEAASYNNARKIENVALYEIGSIFLAGGTRRAAKRRAASCRCHDWTCAESPVAGREKKQLIFLCCERCARRLI
ncbi:hypothetical protein GCM10020331_033190 [Ectobacillus funiculus]